MAKIPRDNHHSIQHQKTNEPSQAKTGRHGEKQVTATDSNGYLDKEALSSNGQDLGSRQVSPQNLDMLLGLANNKQWQALSSAIKLHGKTLHSITEILDTLQDQQIQLPEALQNQICLQYGKLSAMIKAVILKNELPEEPHQELQVLANYLGGFSSPDSPVGVIARLTMDDFIKSHQLDKADRQIAVEQMSATMYELVIMRIKALQDVILKQTVDKDLSKTLKTSQNELRIELEHLRSIQVEA